MNFFKSIGISKDIEIRRERGEFWMALEILVTSFTFPSSLETRSNRRKEKKRSVDHRIQIGSGQW